VRAVLAKKEENRYFDAGGHSGARQQDGYLWSMSSRVKYRGCPLMLYPNMLAMI
jgi:hypothetical protein